MENTMSFEAIKARMTAIFGGELKACDHRHAMSGYSKTTGGEEYAFRLFADSKIRRSEVFFHVYREKGVIVRLDCSAYVGKLSPLYTTSMMDGLWGKTFAADVAERSKYVRRDESKSYAARNANRECHFTFKDGLRALDILDAVYTAHIPSNHTLSELVVAYDADVETKAATTSTDMAAAVC